MKNFIDFIIRASVVGAQKVIGTIKNIGAAIDSVSKSVASVMGAFGALSQIITFAMSLWQMWKERADKAAEAAREALEKQKERLNNMAAALKNWTNSLKETADLQERLEKERLITAEYEARTKAVKEAANAPFDKGLIFLFFFGIMLCPQTGCGKLLIFGNHESATLY